MLIDLLGPVAIELLAVVDIAADAVAQTGLLRIAHHRVVLYVSRGIRLQRYNIMLKGRDAMRNV